MTFFVVVALLDCGILYVLYLMYRKWQAHSQILSDITEERQIVSKLHQEVKDQIGQSEKRVTDLLAKVNQIAAEIEQEIKNSSETISKNIQDLVDDLTSQFEFPLKDLVDKRKSLETVLNQATKERKTLAALLSRSESYIKLFNHDLSYGEVIKEIEMKKYQEARSMLVSGNTEENVADVLGIPLSEVRMIRQSTY